ncbi:MAG: cobalamin-binding protein [Blastocatellia bacterium]|nr:cobalamin-binding protein [Blastocatellia bacterium]
MKSKIFIVLFLFILLACQAVPQHNDSTAVNKQAIVDEIGRQVKIPKDPQRIISLAPSITEMLFALELGDKVVGVTSYCNYPQAATKIPKVSDTLHPNLEMIISLKPDLVLVTTASQLEQFTAKMSELGIAVFVIKSDSVIGVLGSIKLLGQITNKEQVAKNLIDSLNARLEKVKQQHLNQSAKPKVFFIVGTEPLITVGRKAFVTDLINLAGGQSISEDVETEWPAYSIETAISRAPEIILSPGSHSTENEPSKLTLPKGLEVTPAARTGKIYKIDGDLLLRPGPRIIDGLEQIAKLLYSEEKR